MEIKIRNWIVNIAITVLIISCSQSPESSSNEERIANSKVEEPVTIDPYHFKHLIPESDYSYDIDIEDIDFKVHKGAFTLSKEKYDKPEKIDGLSLIVKFSITNPYPKPMRVPFPKYFEITANEFNGLEGTVYSKSCRCHVDNSFKFKNDGLRFIRDNSSSYDLVDFDSSETKKIEIEFEDPFPVNINTVTLIAFNKYLAKVISLDDYYEMSDSERDEMLNDKSKQYGFVIDIATKKIVRVVEYNL